MLQRRGDKICYNQINDMQFNELGNLTYPLGCRNLLFAQKMIKKQ
jgi:hypothetical protein